MSGFIRQIQSSDGEPISPPSSVILSATGLAVFANDAAFEASKGSAGAIGDRYYNSTELIVRQHNGSEWSYDDQALNAQNDSTSTGADIALSPTRFNLIKFVNAGLTSIRSIAMTTEKLLYLVNFTGNDIIIRNNNAAPNDIVTGTGADITLKNTQTILAFLDSISNRVRIVSSLSEITNRGDLLIGDSNGRESRLPIGPSSFVLTSDGTDPVWAAASGGGGSGQGFFNYITNPYAEVNATDGVTLNATTGSWTVTRTTDPAEVPGPLQTAFNISGAGLTVGDTVELDISQVIAVADGERIGTAEVKINDFSSAVLTDYSFRYYDVTNGEYVNDERIFEKSGTFPWDAPMVSGNDYQLHVIAKVASPSNIGFACGLFAESERPGSLIGDWLSMTPLLTYPSGWGTLNAENSHYRQVGASYEIMGFVRTGIPSANPMYIEMGFDIDISQLGQVNGSSPDAYMTNIWGHRAAGTQDWNVTSNAVRGYVLASNVNRLYFTDEFQTDSQPLARNVNDLLGGNGHFIWCGSLPVVGQEKASTPLISDVLNDTGTARFYRNTAHAYVLNTTVPFDSVSTLLEKSDIISNSSGTMSVLESGRYHIESWVRDNAGTLGSAQMRLYKNGSIASTMGRGEDNGVKGSLTVNLTPSDTFDIRINDSFTLVPTDADCWVSVVRVSDYSGRAAGLPFASRTEFGVKRSFVWDETKSTLQVSGSGYTSLPDDGYDTIDITTGGTNRPYLLPPAAQSKNRKILVRKVDTGVGEITMADSVEGRTDWGCTSQYDYVHFQCDGTTWFVIDDHRSLTKALDGDYSNGSMILLRRKDKVDISFSQACAHASTTDANTTVGFVPTWGVPPNNNASKMILLIAADIVSYMIVQVNGTVGMSYRVVSTAAGTTRTNTDVVPSIDYVRPF